MRLGLRAHLRSAGLFPPTSYRRGLGAWYRKEARSLGRSLLGFTEKVEASNPLALDTARLQRVVGQLGAPANGKDPSNARRVLLKQRRGLNDYLGRLLGNSTAIERPAVAQAFAMADAMLPAEVRTPAVGDRPEIARLRESGCAGLGRTLDDEQLAAIHAHLRTKPLFLSHDAHSAAEQVASLADVPADRSYACYDYLDLWASPHILELAGQDRILDIAQGYLGATPTLYSINAFWSFPNRAPHPYSQLFHRDWEDFRSCIVFTQLTPVEEPEEGAHYYVERSHEADRFKASLAAGGIDPAQFDPLLGRDPHVIAQLSEQLFQQTARRFDGPAGQSFCTDGYGLHRALVPHSRPRLLLWMRFGNFFNEGMYNFAPHARDRVAARAALRRLSDTARRRYVFRYLIEALNAV